MTPDGPVEDLLRPLAPQVLGVLVRRYRQFDACEDAVQEALLAAAQQWPTAGTPANPRGWLVTVASRRMTDLVRNERARRRREDADTSLDPRARHLGPAADDGAPTGDHDDTLTLLFLCCHPSLTPASQLALTLRAVGGLSTAEIAAAFLVPEATMAQRISRAKQRIREAGAEFTLPPEPERADRLTVVLQVLYLLFNEGYAATSGRTLQRTDLTREALRLATALQSALPDHSEVVGLLALMRLTDARRAARTDEEGGLVRLADQDRSRWDHDAIAEGVELVSRALARGPLGPYQVQAAIAAVHDEAPSAEATDWRQILALYSVLDHLAPNPMVTLNRAVAVAMVHGPAAGLELIATLDADPRMATHHRLLAVRAHLLEQAGDREGARLAYREAARRTASLPEQRFLRAEAARLA